MAGGTISTGSNPKLLWPGVHETWGQMYDQHMKEWESLYDIQYSDKAYEQDVMITPFGLAPVKPQGGPVSYDSQVQGYVTTYQHIAYALGYIVTHEEVRDNLYKEVATRRAENNAFSMKETIENFLDDPSKVKELKRFFADGEWADQEKVAVATLKNMKARSVFMKRLDDNRWVLQDREK